MIHPFSFLILKWLKVSICWGFCAILLAREAKQKYEWYRWSEKLRTYVGNIKDIDCFLLSEARKWALDDSLLQQTYVQYNLVHNAIMICSAPKDASKVFVLPLSLELCTLTNVHKYSVFKTSTPQKYGVSWVRSCPEDFKSKILQVVYRPGKGMIQKLEQFNKRYDLEPDLAYN